MLWSVKQLYGCSILATGGQIGKVDDFYFDDDEWRIRYLVVDIGKWPLGQRVLVSPAALGQPNWAADILPVTLTQEQVKNSPDIDQDMPVSRQPKIDYWPGLEIPARLEIAGHDEAHKPDPHLRSTRKVAGYHIQAKDGEIGHVEDFIVDDETWIIRYLVVNTGNLLSGKRVLLAPRWVDRVSWLGSKVFVDFPRASIKRGPEYDPLVFA